MDTMHLSSSCASVFTLLAQQKPGGSASESFALFLPWIGVFAVVYIMLILPQRREEKKRKQRLETLKKGDEVLTGAGIIGSVVSIDDKRVELKVHHSGTKIEFARNAIQDILSSDKKSRSEGATSSD